MPDAVAAVLGITQQPGQTVSESVAAAQEGRLRLLVFDNCEHVRDAAADLVEEALNRESVVEFRYLIQPNRTPDFSGFVFPGTDAEGTDEVAPPDR